MNRRSRWKKTVPALATITLTAMPFTVWCPVTKAFFPPVNNQGGASPPTVVVVDPPVNPPVVVVPPVSPPPVVVPPPPPDPCGCHDNPRSSCDTPEPSSLIVGLSGLMAAAGYRWKRKK